MTQFKILDWKSDNSAVFRKTKDKWGGLSNMASGYPVELFGVTFWTNESLYQACRFTEHPEIQQKLSEEKNPMKAKWFSRANISNTRPDWDSVRVEMMKWSIDMKASQNQKFVDLLLETGKLDIVEYSTKDQFWGAEPAGEETLSGCNVLGILLTLKRNLISSGENYRIVEPPNLNDFKFFGRNIERVSNGENLSQSLVNFSG
jgi:ribA/ribD-fused uncharacterized protein